jgi:dethiobiotin synthetase
MALHLLVTGTGTDVGKTVFTAHLVRYGVRRGLRLSVFKPFCSGGREDARILRESAGGASSLDVVNPWHFRPPLAPAIAAAAAGRRIRIEEVVKHVREHAKGADLVVVEGAGGLLSPLASDGDAPALIRRLGAVAVVVAVDRLGVLHEVRATLSALPSADASTARLVLMDPARRDVSCRHNRDYLERLLGPDRVFRFPRLTPSLLREGVHPKAGREFDRLLAGLG